MKQSTNPPALLPIPDAIQAMLAHCCAVSGAETVSLASAHRRVLAADIRAAVDVPPADNSAMDGYAMWLDEPQPAGSTFICRGTVLAGASYPGKLAKGECVRIMTGAELPAGANTVVMQENCQVEQTQVSLTVEVKPGISVRHQGEDIAAGQTVVAAGASLSAAQIALIASVGVNSCAVKPKVKVALIATGDELIEPGKTLSSGQIYESNRYALQALLQDFPIEIVFNRLVADHPKKIEAALLEASKQADLILSSGGVSVGEADFIKSVLAKIGQIDFWKVAIKPGKPFAFGKIGQALFCGLPGNPVSSYVTFDVLVRPLLSKLTGAHGTPPICISATTTEPIRKAPGRADYQRGIVHADSTGKLWVSVNGKQGSAIMTSIANANCYILLASEQTNLPAGTDVKIQLF